MEKSAIHIRRKKLVTTVFSFSLLIFGYYLFIAGPQNILFILNPTNSTPASPLYVVKVVREQLQSLFIFGDMDEAGWHVTLAQKRIEESRILNSKKIFSLSNQQLEKAKYHHSQAQTITKQLQGQTNTDFLVSQLEIVQHDINSINIE